MEYSIIYQLITTPISVDQLIGWCSAQILVINSIIYFREMLTSAFSVLVNNPVKESFYGKRKRKTINVLTIFFISHKSNVKTFLKLIVNKCHKGTRKHDLLFYVVV